MKELLTQLATATVRKLYADAGVTPTPEQLDADVKHYLHRFLQELAQENPDALLAIRAELRAEHLPAAA